MTFGRRLHEAVRDRGPLCAGIDPHPALLAAWGLEDDPAGLERFALTVVDAIGDRVALLKPQSAFFERHGSRGVAVLERVIAEARGAGALVVADVKRGDIGSTVQAYADAYLDPASALCSDAVTASPYLGFGSLRPLLDAAVRHGNGVFVLAITSNPEGTEVQAARTSDGRSVASVVLDHVRRENAGAVPQGSIGCVVGATIGDTGENFDVNGPLLAPGIGVQGAKPEDLRQVFGDSLRLVVPAVSRDLLAAGPGVTNLQDATSRAIQRFTLLIAS